MEKKEKINIKEIRRRAEETIKLCDQFQEGKISGEVLEKRITKDWGSGIGTNMDFRKGG